MHDSCIKDDWALKAYNIPATCAPGANDARQKALREILATRCALARANDVGWGLRESLKIRCAPARASDARASAAWAQGCCG